MKRTGWPSGLIIFIVVAVALSLAGDTLANDGGGKKDKKDKKGKKERVIKKDNERTNPITDPTRAKKSTEKLSSVRKGKGRKGILTKRQTRIRSRQKIQKKSCKRSCDGKK